MAVKARVLVTGAGGFIGHHLVKRLVAEGHWVRGVDLEPPRFEPSAAQAAPVATETAPPEVEPPGMRATGSSAAVAALGGVPWCGLIPTPENANSVMFVCPVSAAPAARSRATWSRSTARACRACAAAAAATCTCR